MEINYYLRPETGSEDRIGPVIGPFRDFLQMTHNLITVGPNGDEIGWYGEGMWHFSSKFRTVDYKPGKGYEDIPLPVDYAKAHNCTEVNQFSWSDVVIWAVIWEPASKA